MIAGVIIGVLLVLAGAGTIIAMARVAIIEGDSLPWNREKGHCWLSVLLLGALGVLALGGGMLLIQWVRRLFSLRILICPRGLVQVQRGETLGCRWEDIAEVKERVVQEHLPILKGGLKYVMPIGKSHSYVVCRRDGKQFAFDGNRVKGLSRLARMIRQEADARGITWNIVEESD